MLQESVFQIDPEGEGVPPVATAGPDAAAIRADPFVYIDHEHAVIERFCDLLESIADGLPDSLDPGTARAAADFLDTCFRDHVALEEEVIFPAILAAAQGDEAHAHAIRQARHEHHADEDCAGELAEALRAAAAGRMVIGADGLGYMLRGFFYSQRRHVAWEDTVLLPAARTAMTEPLRRDLAQAILRRRLEREVVAVDFSGRGASCNGTCESCRSRRGE